MVVRDGTLRGGVSFFYAYDTYRSGNGKWKGEVTNQEHSPTFAERPVWERKMVTIGFTATYTDENRRNRRSFARRQAKHSIQIEAAAADPGLSGARRPQASTLWPADRDNRLHAGTAGRSGDGEGALQRRDAYGARLLPRPALCLLRPDDQRYFGF